MVDFRSPPVSLEIQNHLYLSICIKGTTTIPTPDAAKSERFPNAGSNLELSSLLSLPTQSFRIKNPSLFKETLESFLRTQTEWIFTGWSIQEEFGWLETEEGRKVIEHICLLQGKEDLSEEQEQNMLDYLYTTQYQMRGIIAISLGRVSGSNSENCTHAVYVRFQRKEDLAMFYENHFYTGVIKDHVMPYCHGIKSVDFESEVEDDILPIFRKGEEFNFGLELLLLIEFVESSLDGAAEDALIALDKLTMEFPSLIVQTTKGSNFNRHSEEYTHGVAIRFRSFWKAADSKSINVGGG
nr:stress-response A/B barrel domain-containing protein UP3 isoform X2 [Ipomoea trifida]